MKVYCVEVERPGKTLKAPGISETEIKREQFLFAANSIADVWAAIDFLRTDEEAELTGVWQQHPAIQVLAPSGAASHSSETPTKEK